MSITVTVENDTIKLPVHVPDGTRLEITLPPENTAPDSAASAPRRTLAEREGLYVGFSAAANVCAASKLLSSGVLSNDAVGATVLCDTGLKY